MDQSTNAPEPHAAQTAGNVHISNPEQLAVKIICASDILKNVVELAQKLKKLNANLKTYICQANMLLVWKRGNGALKMAGSVAKIVSSFMLVASRLNPRVHLALRVAHRLWKLGTSIKLVNAIASVMKELWQNGCRQTLLEFTHSAAMLTRNLSVFGEVLRDLPAIGDINGATRSSSVQTAQGLLNVIGNFIPAHQIPYATHVINVALGNEHYSPLFVFTALTLYTHNNSSVSRVFLEMESFNFPNFVETSNSEALVMIGSFLHLSRELLDFLDGFQQLTDQDCRFLQDCLRNLTEESANIMKAVSVLVNLDEIRRTLTTESHSSLMSGSPHSLYGGRDPGESGNLAFSRGDSLSSNNSVEEATNSVDTVCSSYSNSEAVSKTYAPNASLSSTSEGVAETSTPITASSTASGSLETWSGMSEK